MKSYQVQQWCATSHRTGDLRIVTAFNPEAIARLPTDHAEMVLPQAALAYGHLFAAPADVDLMVENLVLAMAMPCVVKSIDEVGSLIAAVLQTISDAMERRSAPQMAAPTIILRSALSGWRAASLRDFLATVHRTRCRVVVAAGSTEWKSFVDGCRQIGYDLRSDCTQLLLEVHHGQGFRHRQ